MIRSPNHYWNDVTKWYIYRRCQRVVQEDDDEFDQLFPLPPIQETVLAAINHQGSRKGPRTSLNLMRNDNGDIETIGPRSSSWYISYVVSPQLNDVRFIKKFRRRFRCSYDSFLKLLEMAKEEVLFQRWRSTDAFGRDCSPIELLLLGSLRYIGRGWTFDDLQENTSISEETHRRFFHKFIQWGSSVLYEKYVSHPIEAGEEFNLHSKEMESCGLHGCIASTDATHVTMNKCPSVCSNEHTGFKESLPSRTYNISVNHRRQILHTTRGHPARWNDKTLARFDTFVMSIKNGSILQDNIFCLLETDENGVIVEQLYKGCWLLCDNGYQKWPTMIAPMKEAVLFTEIRWSKWLESVRKDVECTLV